MNNPPLSPEIPLPETLRALVDSQGLPYVLLALRQAVTEAIIEDPKSMMTLREVNQKLGEAVRLSMRLRKEAQ